MLLKISLFIYDNKKSFIIKKSENLFYEILITPKKTIIVL